MKHPPVPPQALSRKCRWCAHVILLCQTRDGTVLELDISERAWRLVDGRVTPTLPVVEMVAAYARHECLWRP